MRMFNVGIYWGLNPGPHACYTNSLLLTYVLNPFLAILFSDGI